MISSAKTLREVRWRLARGMTARKGGFEYETVFGCRAEEAFHMPHVRVRVELRYKKSAEWLQFEVFVDFQLPNGADLESAELFKKATQDAVKKARWAHGIVDDHEWHVSNVTGE